MSQEYQLARAALVSRCHVGFWIIIVTPLFFALELHQPSVVKFFTFTLLKSGVAITVAYLLVTTIVALVLAAMSFLSIESFVRTYVWSYVPEVEKVLWRETIYGSRMKRTFWFWTLGFSVGAALTCAAMLLWGIPMSVLGALLLLVVLFFITREGLINLRHSSQAV